MLCIVYIYLSSIIYLLSICLSIYLSIYVYLVLYPSIWCLSCLSHISNAQASGYHPGQHRENMFFLAESTIAWC